MHETVPSKYAIVICNLNNEDKNGKVIRIQDVLGGRIIEKKTFYYLFLHHVFISVF